MRKSLLLLLFILSAFDVFAQVPCHSTGGTSSLGLAVSDSTTNWHVPLVANFNCQDSHLSGGTAVPKPNVMGAFPAGTINGVYYPMACSDSPAPSWCSGSDLGAWINAVFSSCSSDCVAVIPPGSYSYSTTIVISKPSESVTGSGSSQTVLSYKGSGDGILWEMHPFTIQKAGTLRGFSLICTKSAINCIHSSSLQGSTWEDLTVSGATQHYQGAVNTSGTAVSGDGFNTAWPPGTTFTINGTNYQIATVNSGTSLTLKASARTQTGVTGSVCGVGILLEDALIGVMAAWTERTYMHNVHIGYSGQIGTIPGNTIGMALRTNGGTGSFGYSDFDIWFNVEANQTGMLVDTASALYHSTVNLKGNIDVTPASFLTVNGAFISSNLNLLAESVSGSHLNAILVGSTGAVNAYGNAVIYAPDLNTVSQGIIPPTVTSGGIFAVEPWLALDYPGAGFNDFARPMIQTAYLPISVDGTIVVAQSNDLQGRLVLSWPNSSNRMAVLILDMACAQFDISCSLSVPVNYADGDQAVFKNPTIKFLNGQPQVQVTIGNRNGVSQNVLASWYGAAGESPVLFPGTSVGTTSVTLVGSLPSGTTGTIRGTFLSGTCDSGTARVTGARPGMPVVVSSTTGVDVGGAFNVRGSVTSENTVTVYVCGMGTPASLAYNVLVIR